MPVPPIVPQPISFFIKELMVFFCIWHVVVQSFLHCSSFPAMTNRPLIIFAICVSTDNAPPMAHRERLLFDKHPSVPLIALLKVEKKRVVIRRGRRVRRNVDVVKTWQREKKMKYIFQNGIRA